MSLNILGISCFFHDAAAALISDGKLLAAAEEERFTRKKHDADFPLKAISFCLKEANLEIGDIDWVVFYEKPFRKFERILKTVFAYSPGTRRVFSETAINWFSSKLWIKNLISEKLQANPERILFTEHHLSHAASCFFCSPFNNSAIITCDSVGEWTTVSLGCGEGNKIVVKKELQFPHSLGLLYSTFTAFLGFEVNEGEYKVMGMSSYGKPRYVDKIYRLLEIKDDGSFSMDMDYFSYCSSVENMFNRKFEEMFGKPRNPSDTEKLDPDYADIAASIQQVFEEIVLKMVNYLYQETKTKNLSLSGGCFLNSKANGRISRETPFRNFYFQPSAGDGGGAIGAALYAYHTLLGKPRSFVLEHGFWGKKFAEPEIKTFLDQNNIAYEFINDQDKLLARTVDYLSKGKVCGWFQGRFEWGPRALGNRSILADPRKKGMKDIVNRKIKFREAFRPFAPSVLAEKCKEYFKTDFPEAYPLRFMMLTVPVREEKIETIPAVVHVDQTARPQIVLEKYNPRYYQLLKTFEQAVGVPLLLNTSFNLKGEAIVNTPEEAYSTFFRSGMDALVMERFFITRKEGEESR